MTLTLRAKSLNIFIDINFFALFAPVLLAYYNILFWSILSKQSSQIIWRFQDA